MRFQLDRYDSDRRSGFTIIELMVVLAAITILLALFIPAVQQTRIAASRIECKNRMRQIGVAIHSHETTFGKFPAFNNDQFSWLVAILPYLELTNIKQSLNVEDGAVGESNAAIADSSVETYCCPADRSRRPGCVNYLGNAGTGFGNWNGFFSDVQIGARDITDGLSNTAAVSECRGGQTDQPFEFIATDTTRTTSDWNAFVTKCQMSGSNKWPTGNFLGIGWLVPGYPTTTYAHILSPGSNSCKPEGDGLRFSVATPHSYHPGGVNVLMADGSVKFASVSMDRNVWRQEGSRSSSEFLLEDK